MKIRVLAWPLFIVLIDQHHKKTNGDGADCVASMEKAQEHVQLIRERERALSVDG